MKLDKSIGKIVKWQGAVALRNPLAPSGGGKALFRVVKNKYGVFTRRNQPSEEIDVTNAPLLSMEETLERMSGDRELLASLFQLFVSDAPKKLDRMAACAGDRDLYGVERTAHSLKGASATVGATMLCEIAAETERAAKAGSWENVDRLRQDLAHVCDQTLAVMRDFCAGS